MSTPANDGGAARQQPPASNHLHNLNRPQDTTALRQVPATTRVRQVLRCDLADLVEPSGELDDREVRTRMWRLTADVQRGQAVVLDVGAATWTMPGTFHEVAEYLADVGAVQVQGAHGAFVREVAEQLEEALR